MSQYARFGCMDCKVMVWLGKTIFTPTDAVSYFHIGGSARPPNWQQPELNRVIWKMLADHARHNLRVVIEGDPEYDSMLEHFLEIGGGDEQDITVEQYLDDWPG